MRIWGGVRKERKLKTGRADKSKLASGWEGKKESGKEVRLWGLSRKRRGNGGRGEK